MTSYNKPYLDIDKQLALRAKYRWNRSR